MNSSEKIVFSRTLGKADWQNTRLVKSDPVAEIRDLKSGWGQDLTVLGSGRLVAQFAQAGLIDEYEILLNPVVLGSGRTMFEGVKDRIPLRLIKSRVFRNGSILLDYEPAR
jgi:dihydrofolate reductase